MCLFRCFWNERVPVSSSAPSPPIGLELPSISRALWRCQMVGGATASGWLADYWQHLVFVNHSWSWMVSSPVSGAGGFTLISPGHSLSLQLHRRKSLLQSLLQTLCLNIIQTGNIYRFNAAGKISDNICDRKVSDHEFHQSKVFKYRRNSESLKVAEEQRDGSLRLTYFIK